MPEIAKQWVAAKAPDGKEFSYKAACYVTSEGEFTIEIHPDIESIAMRLEGRAGVSIRRARSDAPFRVYCRRLDDGIAFLKLCAAALINVEEKTERVIVYRAEFNLAFWEKPDGSIWPNGVGRPGAWRDLVFSNKGTNSTDPTNIYSLGICAAVFDKVTYQREGGATVKYTLSKFKDDQEPGAMLNSFTTLEVATHGIGNSYCKTQEMEYTAQAALFFHDVMLGLCALAKRIDAVIGDKEALAKAIEAKSFKLLPDKAAK